MKAYIASVISVLALSRTVGAADQLTLEPEPYPAINENAWVMIEVWPTVEAITFSAYFLSGSEAKNRNLCAAAKKVFDRESAAAADREARQMSSYRICMRLDQAVDAGLVLSPE